MRSACKRTPTLVVVVLNMQSPHADEQVEGLLPQLDLQVICERAPDRVLQPVDLLVCEASVHGAVGNAVAVRGLLLLRVGEIVNELH